VFAVDVWATANDLTIVNPERIKEISAALLRGEPVFLYSCLPLTGELPCGLKTISDLEDATPGQPLIFISARELDEPKPKRLHLIPRSVYLGIGCRKDTAKEPIEAAVCLAAKKGGLDLRSIAGAASIDLKKDEPGLIGFCREKGWPLMTYSAKALMDTEGGFTASAFVLEQTGADNVCERAASLAASAGGYPVRRLLEKQTENGVTVSFYERSAPLSFAGFGKQKREGTLR
jgi:cobalamin biosynthesis protein CbiG